MVLGNLHECTNSNQAQSFGYDWLNRLTSASTNAAGVGQYNHSYSYDAVGNPSASSGQAITSFAGNAYTYGDPAHKHAVTQAFGNTYGYDANGNQTTRTIGGVTYTFSYDYENRVTSISGSGVSATFVYGADGQRVKGTVNGVTTVYIAGVYEWQGGATTLYYEGSAIRRSGYATDNGVFYLLQDHLKSSSALVNQSGTIVNRNYFYPFGGNRGGTAFSSLTTKRFTGQYHESALPGGEGLSYYGARWYDAQLGRFLSADSIVPGPANPQAFNRYAYVLNSPTGLVDPSGHIPMRDDGNVGRRPPGIPKPSAHSPSQYPPADSAVFGRRWSDYTRRWERATLGFANLIDLGIPVGPNSSYGDGKNYSSMMARDEAAAILGCWFMEGCEYRVYFGPYTAITQEVQIDPQVDLARIRWAEAGYPLPFNTITTIDNRDPQTSMLERVIQGIVLLVKEHGGFALDWAFAPLGYGNSTAVGERDPTGFLGSFDRVSIYDAGDGRVLFEVLNVTGYASGTRVPGTDFVLIEDRSQPAWGPGGSFEQIYYWWEPIPR